ncbi:MAG: hypothetical protein HPY74_13580 [Firmicutes bacterium]|nr:hypothetical protein [Bacillota bacterium]
MIEILQKYRTMLIVLGFAALIAAIILLIALTNKKTEKIPLRGVFVNKVRLVGTKEVVV